MTLRGKARDWKNRRDEFEEEATDAEQEQVLDGIKELGEDDEEFESAITDYRNEVELHNRRFVLRATLTSAFQVRGALSLESQWDLAGSLSFDQHEDGPADLFIAHSQSDGTKVVLAVVQHENASRTYERIQNLCDYVESELRSIEREFSIVINQDEIEGAVAISKVTPENLVEEFDESSNHWPVSIWELVSGDRETVSLVSDFQGVDWTGHSPDGDLTTLLSEGVELADTKHLGIDLFYDSHHQRIYQYLPPYLHNQRDEDGDKKTFHFSNEELLQFLKGRQGSINRNNASERAGELIGWWDYIGVIRQVSDPDGYDDDAEVYSLRKGGVFTGNKVDSMLREYEVRATQALLKKSRQEEYLD
ncbi:hypothetical protein [Halobacterium wangiae]|uniref:hypothetical protein n=1 Tax=Halobacterium wangiae TaxID=2902623 RepID=UPI001E524683|nr:hypothetical protein [Halobacterium wangiae]